MLEEAYMHSVTLLSRSTLFVEYHAFEYPGSRNGKEYLKYFHIDKKTLQFSQIFYIIVHRYSDPVG